MSEWPDPSRPGAPLNPDVSAAHALRTYGGRAAVGLWRGPAQHWLLDHQPIPWAPEYLVRWGWTYEGPMLTPDEVAVAVQAEREACIHAVEDTARLGTRRAVAEAVAAVRARGT